ncbi:deoxyribonuclease-2-beta [Lates calcarifer]|uniref:deoxyribonuclease II n=1 Tax=Lates calcarifer TaxID=8187 RepID=A0AAJ8BK42_LATCA|nr:deoxyribonuclease-2-beta [Lates calcarifer]
MVSSSPLTVPSVFPCHVTTSYDFLFCMCRQIYCIHFQSYSVTIAQSDNRFQIPLFFFRSLLCSLQPQELSDMAAHFSLCFQIAVMFLCCTVCCTGISCRNEAGEPVDWFIIYKLPRYKIGEVGSGVDYMYLDSSVENWQMSKFMVNTSQGAIANTLNQLYMGKAYKSNSSVYALYNDAPPILDYVQGYGHTKGVLLFDRSQGFWLSHSIPHFPSFPERGYLYPSSGKVNGQTALCVTYQYEQFLRIAKQVAYLYPRFYNCSVSAAFAEDLPQLAQLCEGSKPTLASDKRMEQLFSIKGDKFVSFVKSEHYVEDIYTGWAAQALHADLLVESWQRQGHDLPSNCSLPKHTMNIKRIQLPGSVMFRSYHDHSKWCVSQAYEDQVTCVGDLNREKPQLWRGGGLICSFNPLIYKAFRQLVNWYISC